MCSGARTLFDHRGTVAASWQGVREASKPIPRSLVSAAAFAQSDTNAMEDAIQTLEEMFTEVNAFTGGVRFGAEDVESLIDLWAEFEELGGTDDEDIIDFDAILADSTYRSWASSRGLVAEQARLLPVPTAAEAVVLDEYREDLMELMMGDGEDYEEYEEYEESPDSRAA